MSQCTKGPMFANKDVIHWYVVPTFVTTTATKKAFLLPNLPEISEARRQMHFIFKNLI